MVEVGVMAMGMHDCLSRTASLNFIEDLMNDGGQQNECRRIQKHLGHQCSRKCHLAHQKVLHISTGQ